jgi:hypothetical protein
MDKKSTPETAASKSTMRDTASKLTQPDAASKLTIPDAGSKSRSTVRDVASELTLLPDVEAKSTMRDAASKLMQPDVTAPDTVTSEENASRQTVRPGKRSYCTLTLIPEEKEPVAATTLSFSREKIILNRANTEPDNVTITSKEQALLSCEDRRWFIEDRSELKTTCLYVSEKTELKPGDIIVLGDRRFLFDG